MDEGVNKVVVVKFPVLKSRHGDFENCPDFVRLDKLSEKRAQKNHGQTLERLAERGGLSPSEIAANLKDTGWWELKDLDLSNDEITEMVRAIAP